MGPWGFIALAHGIVWGVILIYLITLKRSYRTAEMELNQLRSAEATQNHGQK